MYLAGTVANLALVAGEIGLSARTGIESRGCGTALTETIPSAFHFLPAPFGQILAPVLLAPILLLEYISPKKAFQPDF